MKVVALEVFRWWWIVHWVSVIGYACCEGCGLWMMLGTFLRDRGDDGLIFIGGLLWLLLFIAKFLIGPLGLGLHWTRGPDRANYY